MSNVQDFGYVSPVNKRRPQSPKQAKVDRAVQRYLSGLNGNKHFTSHDVAAGTKQNQYRVLRSLRRLESLKALKRAGLEKSDTGPGRPLVRFTRRGAEVKIARIAKIVS